MAELLDTYERLQPINRATADRYLEVCRASRHSPETLAEFSDSCLAIADAGWRSFESVNALLELLPLVRDEQTLRAVCRQGCDLMGYSFEPVRNYFLATGSAVHEGQQENLPAFEATGFALHAQMPQASGLIAGYFRVGALLMSHGSPASFREWIRLFDALSVRQASPDVGAPASRELLNQFLSRSEATPDVSWPFLFELGQRSAPAVIEYLKAMPTLADLIPRTRHSQVEGLLLQYAGEVGEFLPALQDYLQRQHPDADSLEQLLDLLGMLSCVAEVRSLLTRKESLPLDRPAVLRRWLELGLATTRGNPAALQAYLAGESATSVDTLTSLQGQVNFSDHRRVFDLIAEAMSGRRVAIEAVPAEASELRDPHMPAFDGRQINLPEAVVLFDNEDDNFWYFKVSLYHQLGYLEFGCFDAVERITAELSAMEDVPLARRLFQVVEDARIDWALADRYPGLAPHLDRQKLQAAGRRRRSYRSRRGQLLEGLICASLDAGPWGTINSQFEADLTQLKTWLNDVRGQPVDVALDVTRRCHDLIALGGKAVSELSLDELRDAQEAMPEPVEYRGELSLDDLQSSFRIDGLIEELEDLLESEPDDAPRMMSDAGDPDNPDIDELTPGEVPEGVGVVITELQQELGEDMSTDPLADREALKEFMGGIAGRSREAARHSYDEWDHTIGDYRRGWCTLHEHRNLEEDEDYVRRTLVEYQSIGQKIRQELNKVRPENLRKVKGVSEGEELDLERSIDYLLDRRAGLSPPENIYIQRQRKERDVSTLFLLDMSASTDDIIPDPDQEPLTPPDVDDDEYLVEYFRLQRERDAAARRIIDLEKQSVILMAEALEKLGDSYSVCGFSGYGREQVDYFLAKDFDEPFDPRSRGRLGGIRPCRSTRMGAPIRHATRRLLETGSRIKALIIISDGYPQDHDYGADRNSKDYGLMDTMKALSEARQQGVLSYCLTVDPSGHDYLRAMCPDSQYMVIQDIEQLPEELSRVYRSLTG